MATRRISKEEEIEDMSPETVAKRLEIMRTLEHRLPYDPWAQPVETFEKLQDLVIPGIISKKKGATLSDQLDAGKATFRNWFRNVMSMRMMADDKGFPGIAKTSPWSLQIFKAKSTSDSAWVAPIRRAALDTYTKLNTAVAERNESTIKELSIGDMRAHYLQMVRKQDPSRIYKWHLLGERTPCRILSVRAVPANMGQVVPGSGSRLLTQVLVRFDTLQSLEVYSKRGTLLHKQDPRAVVEYLALQRRMWYNSPWVVRDVLYEGLEVRSKTLS
ncbi:hypothetical protein FOMPIDRAFT_116918 [Fomitopsis schrenkii]|uniref:Tim44-like domain-containing protein n=1 Tax=Fomitopsis schrenkii TaxID=2126942 RepID=S8DR24_FOMSC|nr:hypothetical protein FOMPIDRAFT_116918 [Fomitopsis schrenkii]